MSVITLTWTLLAAMFLGFSLRGALLARTDLIKAARSDGEMVIIAEGRERRAVVRVIGFTLFLVVGVSALLPITAGMSLIAIGGLFIGMIALGVEDIIEQIDRSRLRRLHREGPSD